MSDQGARRSEPKDGGLSRRSFAVNMGSATMFAAVWELAAAVAAEAQATPPAEVTETIAPDHVKKLAERVAAREFVKPKIDVPEPFSNLTLEQYRDIKFRPDQAIWRGEKLNY